MSWLDVIQSDSARSQDAALTYTPGLTIDDLGPSSWEGLGHAIGEGGLRGLARVADAAALAGSVPVGAFDAVAGTDLQDAYFRDVVGTTRRAVDFWAPDVRTTGHAAQVVGSLFEGLSPLAAGPEALMATGLSRGADLIDQGGSAAGGAGAAAISAAAAGLGLKVPMVLGKSLVTRIATGAAGNVAFGAAAAGAEAAVLRAAGDDHLAAERLDALRDPETHLVQALMGAAFGLYGHFTVRPPRVRKDVADAILTSNNANHFTQRSAPGAPVGPQGSALHQAALEEAIGQLNRGERVNVAAPVGDVEFAPRAADDRGVADGVAEVVGAEQMARVEAYRALAKERVGNERYFNADLAKELDEVYRSSKESRLDRSDLLQPQAKADRDAAFAAELAKPAKPGEVVTFMAGGTSSGKSTGRPDSGIVYDTTLAGYDDAVARIDQALATGRLVKINYVFAEPVNAFRRMLARIDTEGRPVPLRVHAETHRLANETVARLQEHYSDDPRVDVTFFDNSGPLGSTHEVPVRPVQEYNGLDEQLRAVLEAEHQAGRVSDAALRRIAGDLPEPVRQGGAPGLPGARRDDAQDHGRPEPGQAPELLGRTSPAGAEPAHADLGAALSALEQVASTSPDTLVAAGLDADGQPIYRRAGEILDEIRAELKAAEVDGAKYEAAVTCLLGNGA